MILNREVLRNAAASRRTNDLMDVQKPMWPCEFCRRDFVTESGFMRHVCAERERLEELRSPRGQAAYSFYAEWMRLKKRSVPAQETFMTSRQYKHFIKFKDWSEKTAIPSVLQFIKLMVQAEVEPVLWCRDTTFAMYLQWYDGTYSPLDQFIETLDSLIKSAEEHEVPLSKIYPTLGPSALAKLIRRRKLSPWLLALSPNFLDWVQRLPDNDRDLLATAVNFGAFATKIQQNPELAREFRLACEASNV